MNLSLSELQQSVEGLDIVDQIRFFTDRFPGQIVFSSSMGQEDQVITDMIGRNQLPVRIFTLDTGRLFNETYELIDRSRARYALDIEVYFPAHEAVEKLVTTKGMTSFYESVENRKECCHIRKVEPLNRALQDAVIWITGIRADQSDSRKEMTLLEEDQARRLIKFNPLLQWSLEDVTTYLHTHHVPYNPLHDRGFVSIGCAPCTRAIEPGEDPRAGRWWWETSQKECGLHIHP